MINKISLKRKKTKLSNEKLKLLESEGELWHERMGHISQSSLNRLKYVATGVTDFVYTKTMEKCTTCGLAKLTKKVFDEDRERATKPCETVHADLIGEISPSTIHSKNKYILTLIDDYTRYLQVFTIRTKTEVSTCLELGLRTLRTMFPVSYQFRTLRCDNGTEFVNSEIDKILQKYQLKIENSEPNAHEHNGLIERVNRTIEEKIRSLIIRAGFPEGFWGMAAHCAAYLYNRTPHSALNFITPYEKAFDKLPDLSYLRKFGARTYVLDESVPKGRKAKPRSIITYLVGFTSTGYVVYDPKTRKTMDVCNAKVDETTLYRHDYPNEKFPNILFPQQSTDSETGCSSERTISEEVTMSSSNSTTGCSSDRTELNSGIHGDTIETEIEYDWDEDPKCFYKLQFYENHFDKHIYSCDEVPITYDEAITGKSKQKWLPAIRTELDSMSKHEVWNIVSKTKDMKPVPTKWIFSIKHDGTYKARLVVIGCNDSEKYTPSERASPTPSLPTIRWLLAFASINEIYIRQLDFRTAFLHGTIDREKYITIPQGLEIDRRNFVAKLNKALYGLAISPRCWYQTFDKFIRSHDFTRNCREPCIYTKQYKQSIIILLIYVDDILLFSRDNKLIAKTLELLRTTFEIKDLGFPSTFLGIEITKDEKGYLQLSQQKFVLETLKNFNMIDANSVPTPITTLKIDTTDKNSNEFPYKKATGTLLFLANTTRPDICFAVNYVSRFQANPKDEHWKMVKRIFRYLKGTTEYKLKYDKNTDKQFEVYVDADYGGDPTTRRSTTGYLITYNDNVIHWRSHLQQTIARSTTEAEYIAICDVSTEILFLVYLSTETIERIRLPVTLFEDNTGAISQCEKTSSRGRLKYLEQKLLEKQELFERKILKTTKIDTNDQLADVFTKPLSTTRFLELISKLLDISGDKRSKNEPKENK
jgi:ribosomal protein S8/transposase InsO family protein